MPNPQVIYAQIPAVINDFLSDPNNENSKKMAALAKDRKRLAKEIRDMHLSHLTDGVSTDVFSKEERTDLEKKKKALSEKDNLFWDTIKNEVRVYFSQKSCTVEQLSMQMNHGEEMARAEEKDDVEDGIKTNWTLKSPYSLQEQHERSKVRNELSKKVFTELIDRMRSVEQQQRLGGQMRLNRITDEYIFGAAYSTKPGEPDPDKARAVESFSCLDAKSDSSFSKEERKAYTREFYNVFRKTFDQIKEKKIDLNQFSDMTLWKNPNGTWNDRMLVENYETISLLDKISTASASINEIGATSAVLPDEECERFCRENDLQLSLSSALMDRLSYILNPYYDEIDLDDPRMKQTFSPVLSSPKAQTFKNLNLKTLPLEDINEIWEEENKSEFYFDKKIPQFEKLNPSSKADSVNITDLFTSWTHNQYQGFKHNIRALANAMRTQGNDLKQLRMHTDCDYRFKELLNERDIEALHELQKNEEELSSGDLAYMKDLEKRKGRNKDLWKKKAGATLSNLSEAKEDLRGDVIFTAYWLIMNTSSEYVTFTSLDENAKELKIPVSVMMNPDFAKDLKQRLQKEEKSALPKKPENGADAKEKEKYEYEKVLYDIEELYRNPKNKSVLQEKQAEPLSLEKVQKEREDRIAEIIKKNAEKVTFTDKRDSKQYDFPSLPEEWLRQLVYADEVQSVKDRGAALGKVTPKAAEEAINEARLSIIDAVNFSNEEKKDEDHSLTVESFLEAHKEKSVTEAKKIVADYQNRQRKDPERDKKREYTELLNVTEVVFDKLWEENDKLVGSKQSMSVAFGDLIYPLTNIFDVEKDKIPYYWDGLQDLHERVEKKGTLVGREKDLLPLWEKVKGYADGGTPSSNEDYIKAKEKYDEECKKVYTNISNNCYLRYLSKLAKARKDPTSTLDLIAEVDLTLAMQKGEKYHLTPSEIDDSYQNYKKAKNRFTSRINQVKNVERSVTAWEDEHGLENGHIAEMLAKDPNLKVDSAKAMVENSKNMAAVKGYAKKLGVPADVMLKGLEARQKEFPRCTAKFFYEDTKQNFDTACKTFDMTQKEFFKYCQESNNDPIAFAKKASTNGMPLAFATAAEEYGMSCKEFLEYCQETNRDPLVLAQRTAAESRGEYNALGNQETLMAESKVVEAIQDEAIDLEETIKGKSVKEYSDEMVANLKKLSIATDNEAESLWGKVKRGSLAEVLLIGGNRFYNDVIAEVQTKAEKGDMMSSTMEKQMPLYMLAARELLKEQLKSGKGEATGLVDYLNCYKGKDQAKGLKNLVTTMTKIEGIKETLNNMSAYDLRHSLNNGTFMKNLGIGAVQTLNNTLRQEAQRMSAGKQPIDENQVVQGEPLVL